MICAIIALISAIPKKRPRDFAKPVPKSDREYIRRKRTYDMRSDFERTNRLLQVDEDTIFIDTDMRFIQGIYVGYVIFTDTEGFDHLIENKMNEVKFFGFAGDRALGLHADYLLH